MLRRKPGATYTGRRVDLFIGWRRGRGDAELGKRKGFDCGKKDEGGRKGRAGGGKLF